jgi:hypothetical protein
VLAGPANRDATKGAQDPALVQGATSTDVWMAWSEDTEGGSRQIFVSQYDGVALQTRGGSLNLHSNVQAGQPSITLAGENRLPERAPAWPAMCARSSPAALEPIVCCGRPPGRTAAAASRA